jgi:fatty acid desaturase
MRAADFLTADELKRVRHRSDLRGLFCALHSWAVILGSMALFAWWPNPLTFVFGWIVIGSRQLGLAILMHDGAHGVLTNDKTLNNWVSQWLCAYPMFAETFAYRDYHLTHHRRTQQADDPDLSLSAPFPISRASFRRKIVRDLTGQTAFQQRRSQIKAALGDPSWGWRRRAQNFGRKLGRPLVANAILFYLLASTGHWYLYPALWLFPFLTWFQVVVRVRNIAEHAIVPDNDDPFRNARTTKTNLLGRALLAPYWVNYHVEHHILMWVPCYNLPRFHRILLAKGFGPRMEIRPTYRNVLADATSRAANDDRRDGMRTSVRGRRRNVAFEGRDRAGVS